jgi:hypothetical protein
VFLGVSKENAILYYDETRELVVEYFGEPDPYSRVKETKIPKVQLEDWLMFYHWEVGLSHRNI